MLYVGGWFLFLCVTVRLAGFKVSRDPASLFLASCDPLHLSVGHSCDCFSPTDYGKRDVVSLLRRR